MSNGVSVLRRQSWWLSIMAAGAISASSATAPAGLRRVQIGEPMPEFSLTGVRGETFRYDHEQSGVFGIIVMQATESRLERIGDDVETLMEKFKADGRQVACIGVMSGPGAADVLRARDPSRQASFPIFPDPDFALWGRLGVVAAPTAVVVGADHKVRWVKAGYGYDFLAGFHAQLAQALHPAGQVDASVEVRTLENASARARRLRHIQMARTLAKKGRFEAAIQELRRVHDLDPNAVDVSLELAEVRCLAGKNEEALKTVAEARVETNQDKARALLISGCVKRRMNELDSAESLLTRALQLEPGSARILYELGRVHEAKGDVQKALSAYRRALAEVFGDARADEPSQE